MSFAGAFLPTDSFGFFIETSLPRVLVSFVSLLRGHGGKTNKETVRGKDTSGDMMERQPRVFYLFLSFRPLVSCLSYMSPSGVVFSWNLITCLLTSTSSMPFPLGRRVRRQVDSNQLLKRPPNEVVPNGVVANVG